MSKPKSKKQKSTGSIDDIPFGQMGHVAYDQDGNPVKVHAPKGDPDGRAELRDSPPDATGGVGQVNHVPSSRDWKPVDETRPPNPEEIDDDDDESEEEDSVETTTGEPVLTVKETAYLKLLAHAGLCQTPGCAAQVEYVSAVGKSMLEHPSTWPLCSAGRALRAKL